MTVDHAVNIIMNQTSLIRLYSFMNGRRDEIASEEDYENVNK